MKAKRLVKKVLEVPDKLRRKTKRFLRHNKSVFLKTKLVRNLRRYGRMEAGRALRLFAKYLSFQVSIRPRIRLVTAVIFALFVSYLATSQASAFLQARKGEIKINGQAILVADKAEVQSAAPEMEFAISSKESPFDFIKPANGYVSQGFRGYHRAVDITGDLGSDIKPLGKGKVEFTGYLGDGRGYTVIVDHGEGLKSLYAHMGKIYVGIGNEVTSSQALGSIGLTGRTTGPHVHVEVHDNGIAVDPAKLLP